MSGHVPPEAFSPELVALMERAKSRLPQGITACCQAHVAEALIERGCRAMLEEEKPESGRMVGSLTVSELAHALGQPELESAREAIARHQKAKEAAAQEAHLLHEQIGAIRQVGSISRITSDAELEKFVELIRASWRAPPRQALVVHTVYMDERGPEAGPKVITTGVN